MPNVLVILQNTTYVAATGLPGIPLPMTIKQNTRSRQTNFSFEDIHVMGPWSAFTLANILATFGHLFKAASYPYLNPVNALKSPVDQECDENGIVYRLSTSVFQILRRSLRSLFQAIPQPMSGATAVLIPPDSPLSEIVHDVGASTIFPGTEILDYAACFPGPAAREFRLPGDCKVDCKWLSQWMIFEPDDSQSTARHQEYLQVLSQIYFYMNKTKSRYFAFLAQA